LFVYLIAAVCVHGDWQAFYQNAYLGLKNGIDLSFLPGMFISQYFMDMVPCYVVGGIVVWLAMRKTGDRLFRLIATGAGLSFIFAVVTGLKTGSSNNYFTEFLVFVVMAIPYVLQSEAAKNRLLKVFGRGVTVRDFTYFALVVLITSKTVGLFSAVYIEHGFKNEREEYRNEQQLYTYFKEQLHLKTGEHIFFSDRKFLDNVFAANAIMPTKDVVSQVYRTDITTYDYSAFVQSMNSGLVQYIVTTAYKPDINEWNKTIPFIIFDTSKFGMLNTYAGYTIYVYTVKR